MFPSGIFKHRQCSSGLQRDYLYFKSGGYYKTNKQTKKEEKNAQRSLLTWNAPNAFYARVKLSLANNVQNQEDGTVDNVSNIRNEKTWPFKTEAFQHMGNQRSSSHEEFEFAPVSCCCLHCRE